MITINKPYLQQQTGENAGYTRLCSDIQLDGEMQNIWYEVDNEYAQYLCSERADAFLVAVLPLAAAFHHDIKIVDCPVSEQIFWQIRNILLPALDKYSNYYKNISIDCSLDNTKFDSFAVGTGFSSGVDSFYTLLKNHNAETTQHNITHLTFFNVGACGSYGGKNAEDRFRKRISLYENYVKSLGVGYVKVNSNISEFVMMSYNFTHSFRSMSAALALQKLFKTYYYSAGHTLDEFCFDPYDSAFFDLLNVQCFSNENTLFYSTGGVETREEKLEYISQFPETYELLNVCNQNDENCRTCEKCVRTMTGLYAINALEKYDKVFDVPYYKQHLSGNLAFVLSKSKDGTMEAIYYDEIIKKLKVNGKKIPFAARIKAIPLSLKFKAIAIARKNKKLRKWWHQRINKKDGVRFADVP